MFNAPNKSRILIATTISPVDVLLLTEEAPAIGRSVACIGGTTETADIDAAYNAFVARSTGVVERMFGPACYRLDVSGRIDVGSSWQLGVLTAHALHASGRLALEKSPADSIIWATGSVRAVDLTVGAVGHINEKLAQSLDRFKSETEAGRRVLVVIPSMNERDISPEIGASLHQLGIDVLALSDVPSLLRYLGLQAASLDMAGARPSRAVVVAPAQLEAQPVAGRNTRRRTWVAAVCAVVVLGFAALAWSIRNRATLDTTDASARLQAQLEAALAKSLPDTSAERRTREAEAFIKTAPSRAMAIAPQARRLFRTRGWPSKDIAEEKALERCQQFHDEPCALIAANDTAVDAGPKGELALKDAPRVRYTGVFNPERVPAIRKSVEQRGDVAGYLTAAVPKASAFHAVGILHVVTGAASQRAAEEQALRGCNDDPARKEIGGPCYLYSVDTRVVLTLRATVPLSSATPAPTSLPAFRVALHEAMAKLAPAYANRQQQVNQYLDSGPHRALAVFPPSGSWRSSAHDSAQNAEDHALETCQVRYGEPCILVAVNDTLHSNATPSDGPRRSMPRAIYDGPFDPDKIPAIIPAVRQRADVAGYRSAPGPKAAAFHHWGRLFIVVRAPTQRVAEERALDACNRDADRGGRDGPCFLYAIDDTVVLLSRLIVPRSGSAQ